MPKLILLETFSNGGMLVLFIIVAISALFMVSFSLKMAELVYVMRYRKPFYISFPFFLKTMATSQKHILKTQFQFYQKLSTKHQAYFEHRVVSFIKDKRFIGRDGLLLTDEMKVLISATAVMLTFGFRNFKIGLIKYIFIYPDEFYSTNNDSYHKGEFNPKLGSLVLSWKDFQLGFENGTDKINLGIHEFAHAIHLSCIKCSDVSATIFSDTFKELTNLLTQEEELRKELIESRYFRSYGYTNQFEFLAVLVESFIESPAEFKSQFPTIYKKTKQMLNFNFAGY